eukprot:gb/GECH01014627.1/.p1 GENE.gb/GECH01014627.1/~~gb/GECH01014627.1/.p1  ORF type:complete len:579 (+),score=129.77 gb/GECH01014627.1/:1-1737(+)
MTRMSDLVDWMSEELAESKNERKLFEEFRSSLSKLQQNLHHADRISHSLVGLLERVENRFDEASSDMKYLDDRIAPLQTANMNIKLSINESEEILHQLESPKDNFQESKSSTIVSNYITTRSNVLTDNLNRIIICNGEQRYTNAIKNLSNDTIQSAVSIFSSHQSLKMDPMRKKSRFYEFSTDPFIEITEEYISMLKDERNHFAEFLQNIPEDEKTNVPSFERGFAEIATPSLKEFDKKSKNIGNEMELSENLFVLLDVAYHLRSSGERWRNLGQAIRLSFESIIDNIHLRIFDLLQDCIEDIREDSIPPNSETMLHEFTVLSMNFLKRIVYFELILKEVISNKQSNDRKSKEQITSLSEYVETLLSKITNNLENKSKGFKNESLESMFIITNIHHVLKHISNDDPTTKDKEENSPLLKRYVTRATEQLYQSKKEQHKFRYLEDSWAKAIQPLQDVQDSLPPEGTQSMSRSKRHKIKGALSKFNEKFKDLHSIFKNVGINNEQLRQEIIEITVSRVKPVYASFLKHAKTIPFSSHKNKYLTYDAKTLEDMLHQIGYGVDLDQNLTVRSAPNKKKRKFF